MAAHIVIAGGGIAAVESIAALRALLGNEPRITLVTQSEVVDRKAASVAAPFGQVPEPITLAEIRAHAPFELHPGLLDSVDAARREIVCDDGERIGYDKLIVATGAVPWLPFPGAVTFAGLGDTDAVVEALQQARQVAFVVWSASGWSLPLYEMGLMASLTYPHLSVAVVTAEPVPLYIFGVEAIDAIRGLLAKRGVGLLTGVRTLAAEDGQLKLADTEPIDADLAIALPQLFGPRIKGLPHDDYGFIPVDLSGAVTGVEHVYAAGDVTIHPLKQGGLAAQQADAVVEAIAASLGADITPTPFQPTIRGLLLTGEDPVYLRSDGSRGASRRLAHVAISGDALWWPPAKIAGRYLAPALASAGSPMLYEEPMRDLVDRLGEVAPGHEDAADLALALAQEDASRGDYARALHSLETAQALNGGELPPVWERNRTLWRARAAWD